MQGVWKTFFLCYFFCWDFIVFDRSKKRLIHALKKKKFGLTDTKQGQLGSFADPVIQATWNFSQLNTWADKCQLNQIVFTR